MQRCTWRNTFPFREKYSGNTDIRSRDIIDRESEDGNVARFVFLLSYCDSERVGESRFEFSLSRWRIRVLVYAWNEKYYWE